ncbi:hypothetical protein [Spirosoma validum]|uniref:Uncharacterized protein n=1 Tax=Spirosoma validum TaxID=2771355 RepID=A0A927B864_9BACT|nr:hypothetical protein [Spirosoma validum]MBD2757506.1 hypothetical protein [Spirosoma validum]
MPDAGSLLTRPGPLKAYVLPPVAVSVTLVTEQVKLLLATRLAVGALVLPVTVVEATWLQPLVPVAVTEYTPAALTLAVGPLLIWVAPALKT